MKPNKSNNRIPFTFSCLTLAFLPKEYSKAFMIVYMLGKLSASACFALVWNITAELYPTNLRAQVCQLVTKSDEQSHRVIA